MSQTLDADDTPARGTVEQPSAERGAREAARALLLDAWTLCYSDSAKVIGVAEQLSALGDTDAEAAAWGAWHLALAASRLGDLERAKQALTKARQAFAALGHAVGQSLCMEVEGIARRREGDLDTATRLVAQCDARGDLGYDALQRFIVHNSRAILHRATGRADDALRHMLLAQAEAEASRNTGAKITALINLGALQQDLHNLEDACRISEQALAEARLNGVASDIALVAHNLVVVYYAQGQPDRAYGMARELRALLEQDSRPELLLYNKGAALGYLSVGLFDEAESLLGDSVGGDPGDPEGKTFRAWLDMRCALGRGRAAQARAIGEARLAELAGAGAADLPFDLMEIHRALSEACEALGDAPAALAGLRQSQRLYEQLAGCSARARRVTLEVGFDLAGTQRERDHAQQMHQRAEADRLRLTELNQALRSQIEANELLQQRLLEQALRDPLTGLHNRRYLLETAPALLELARRRASPLCVVLLDLDHFKQFNDRFGHQVGDELLRAFAERARSLLRRSDLLSRYGGEEFVAVMPEIDVEGAHRVLGRLLQACMTESLVGHQTEQSPTTFSAGIALFPTHADSLEHLLRQADLALYAAKGLGRARIETAPSSQAGALN